MMSANKSLEKKNFPSGWTCYKTIGSYVSCVFIEIWSTWEVWRALKKLELLSAMPWATLTHLWCSPNFLCASYLDERTLRYEPIVKHRSCDDDSMNLCNLHIGITSPLQLNVIRIKKLICNCIDFLSHFFQACDKIEVNLVFFFLISELKEIKRKKICYYSKKRYSKKVTYSNACVYVNWKTE